MTKKLISLLLAACMIMSCFAIGGISASAAETSATKTVTVGVINYVINNLGATGYKIHYWGGADGTKDVDLTATNKTEKKAVGQDYWSNEAQTFSMYTAEIPADAIGWKVHKGDTWFGDDGTAENNAAWIFNYSGDKALYETYEVETEETTAGEDPSDSSEPEEEETTEDPLSTNHCTEQDESQPASETPAGEKAVKVGVISYVIDDIGATGYQIHYWGGADGAKDVDLTATNKTEKKAVGEAYWNNEAQTFSMYTANIPSDATGWKVHNDTRWFGNDATATATAAYVFNYDGDKALYVEEEVEETTVEETTKGDDEETTVEETTVEETTKGDDEETTVNYDIKNIYVDFTKVTDAPGSTWYAWTWDDGQDGEWRNVEKFGYVAVKDNVLFANFANLGVQRDWKNVLAKTVDIVCKDKADDALVKVLNTKDNEGKYLVEWAGQEETTVEDSTTLPVPEVKEYYLAGYINGNNYGIEADIANNGVYKFVDGKLTTTFESDSYVIFKEKDAKNVYWKRGWDATATSATFYNQNSVGEDANKLFVPGGVQVEFTLTDNGDDTFVLSYTTTGGQEDTTVEETTKGDEEETTIKPDDTTKTIKVGVISYVINEAATGYQIHYWGGADGEKDVDLTATNKTEQKAVGEAYWNNEAQTFSMYTAEIPADATGWKVHNGNRWFGGDATATATAAYVFNYDGDKALYVEEEVEETTKGDDEETTVEETTIEETTGPVVLTDGYYLITPDWTVDAINPANKFTQVKGADYILTTTLAEGDKIKVVEVTNGIITHWLPEGMDNEYTVDAAHAGEKTIYLNIGGKDDYSEFGGFIYIFANNVEPTTVEPTTVEPTTVEPTTVEPTDPPVPGSVTLKLAAPTSKASRSNWTSAVFYYGTSSKITDDKITKLTMTDTGEKFYTQDTFNSTVVTGGAWTVYSVTLTPEQAQEAVAGKFAGFATANTVNRTTFTSNANVLKAGVDSFTTYASTVGDINALDGKTFIFANAKYGATDIVSYEGYWMSDFVTIRTAAPMANTSYSRWEDVSFYYGTGRWADMNKIQMVNTKENTKVTNVPAEFTLKAGRWTIFAVSVPATVAADIDAAASAGFCKTGENVQNRTNNNATYNVFKAKVNDFSATYNTAKGAVADFEDKVFVIADTTGNKTQSVANYIGVWETEDVYTAGNDDTITIYFAAPIGKAGTTASWNTGVELYYGNHSNYDQSDRLDMTSVDAVKNVVIDNEDIANAVVSGDWDVYAVELNADQIKAIDESGRVGFIKKGTWERTSYSMKMDVTRAGAFDAPGYGAKQTIETKDGMIFVITGAYDAKGNRANYTGAWDFFEAPVEYIEVR